MNESRRRRGGAGAISLQRVIASGAEQIPVAALSRVLSPKLRAAGVRRHRKMADALAEHITQKKNGEFIWDEGGPDRDIDIRFSHADLKELERLSKKLVDTLPDLVERLTTVVADRMRTAYVRKWKEARYQEQRFFQDFQNRLEDRWGEGLDLLRVLWNICQQIGESYDERLSRSRAQSGRIKRSALVRLHVRACQVCGEIITLLENGYADGAMARWRTLDELTTVAILISAGGDDLAERYMAFEAVETKKALDQFIENHEALGYAPPSKRELRTVNRRFEAVKARYGKDFTESHGWASQYLSKKSPRFSDLQRAAGRSSMQPYYKFASYNVHATPKGLAFRVATLDDPGLLIAGSSNAGLEEPGQNMAVSLTQVTHLLLDSRNRMDDIATMKVLLAVRDEAVFCLQKADRVLRRDDADIRRAIREFENS